jgi:hypothetical protein
MLKQALERLTKILGQSIVELLVYDLERQGMRLDKEGYYTLDQIRQVFGETFGEDGASLLTERLRKELE